RLRRVHRVETSTPPDDPPTMLTPRLQVKAHAIPPEGPNCAKSFVTREPPILNTHHPAPSIARNVQPPNTGRSAQTAALGLAQGRGAPRREVGEGLLRYTRVSSSNHAPCECGAKHIPQPSLSSRRAPKVAPSRDPPQGPNRHSGVSIKPGL